jgi:hypothetical protein
MFPVTPRDKAAGREREMAVMRHRVKFDWRVASETNEAAEAES